MSLAGDVVAHLEGAGIGCCLIGAAAIAIHGAPRSTQDIDLLVVDSHVLAKDFWGPLQPDVVRTVRGDQDDPLAGSVRLGREGEPGIDVVVGRWKWQRDAVERAALRDVDGDLMRVADAADLVLLKLDAGGPRDRNDIEALIEILGESLVRTVEARVASAPAALRSEWERLRAR